MKTRIILPDTDGISEAGAILRYGGLVAFPTETVYGLGANALDATATKHIYEAKGRPSDNPMIVHVASIDMLNAESHYEQALARAYYLRASQESSSS